MESSGGPSLLSGFTYPGGQNSLPPKRAFNFIFPSYVDQISSSTVGDVHHNRASSDSFIEQPSWLDELLDEPEVPSHKAHRRSSSDSVAFLDTVAQAFMKDETKLQSTTTRSSWESQGNDHQENLCHNSFHVSFKSFDKRQNKIREPTSTSVTSFSSLPSSRDWNSLQTSGSSFTRQERAVVPSKATVKQNQGDQDGSSAKNDSSSANHSVSRTESKRAKQQHAQRSRLRKLQYIAELERNVQILQAEGSEVTAAVQFLDRQILILGMENQALKQRLDSLSREQLIKYMEQDMLEREIARLQFVYRQQQQQQQQKHSAHHRSKSRELELQLANLYI